MNSKILLEKPIDELKLKISTLSKLKLHSISNVKDLWNLNRKDLKSLELTDNEINQIIIKLQLNGMDLNKKIY